MPVRTTADERIDSAKDHIDEAIKDLSEVLFGKCWGCDDYTKEHTRKLGKLFDDLRKAKEDFEND